MKKRILSTFLALCMCLSLLPTAAFAAEADAPGADTPSCTCETACTADTMNADCPACGTEGAAAENCGQYAASETGGTAEVQALIDALPAVEDVTAADYDAVQDVCDAYEALTEDQQAQIVGLAKLTALLEWFSQQIDLTAGIQYLDANGNEKTAASYTAVSSSTGDVTWTTGGWYVVSSDVTISGKLTMNEDVHLILCDGKTLTVNGGILSSEDLTLYGQSASTGKLTAGAAMYGDKSKSIVCDDLTVNGGSITATGGDVSGTGAEVQSCGIYCDDLTVNGGSITAVGGSVTASSADEGLTELEAVSYGLNCDDLTVNGGSIDAASGDVTCSANVESKAYSYAIDAGDVTLKNGSIKVASGDATYISGGENQGDVRARSMGFYFDDLTMESGALTATAGKATTTLQTGGDDGEYRARSLAIHGDDMVISGGTVTATADDAAVHVKEGGYYASTYSCGIYADLTVTGGTVTAAAGENAEALLDLPSTEDDPDEISARVYSCGIISYEGDMVYNGGTVTATFGDSSYSVGTDYEGDEYDYSECAVSHNFGIYSYEGRVSVTGGTIVGDVGGNGKLNISGGTIEGASTEADATLTISGGTLDYVSAADDSTVVISGGTVETMHLYPDATPVLTGGTFESITWVAEDGGDAPNLVDALADGYAYYIKGSDSTTYDTLTTPSGEDWYSTVENVQIKVHTCDFVKTGDTYTCVCGRTGHQEKIAYLDANGTTQYRVDYKVLDGSVVDGLELTEGWYAVKGDVTLTGTINLQGDVHLILCDNAKLSTSQLSDDGTYDLTVYAQSTGDKMGSLFAGNYTQNSNTDTAISLYGDLTVVGGSVVAAGKRYGIDVSGDLTVLGGSVKGTGNFYGIYVSEEITVSGGVLEGVGDSEDEDSWDSTGVRCSLLYVTGGKIIGTGGARHGDYSSSRGIYVRDGMTVSGGIVEGTGGQASGTGGYADSSGIYVSDDVTISGGTITAKSITAGVDTTPSSYGFSCWDLTVSGGTITATAGEAIAMDDRARSYGIYCEDLTVSDGTITATGNKASGELTATAGEGYHAIVSVGIYCEDVNITGGTVTAKGDTAAYSGESAIATFSYGMNCDSLNIKGGSLTVTGSLTDTGSGATCTSAGVFSNDGISINGGTLTAKTEQTRVSDSAALYACDEVTLGSSMKITTPTGGAVKNISVGGPLLYTVVEQDSTPAGEVVIQKVSSSGSGSSGSSSNTTSTTTKNPDGSTTTTTTDKKTGNVTETTKNPNGVTGTTVTDKTGTVTDISANVPVSAAKDGETVTLPIDAVKPSTSDKAPEIKVDVPKGGATIEIPVENPTPGTVVVIVDKDGTETVVPGSKVTENGVEVTLTEDAVIKVIDNSKNFADVPNDAYFADAVQWASARNITGGIDENHFGPDLSCTRAQIVTFLWKIAGQPVVDYAMDFADVSEDAYYAEAVRWAASQGIVSGYGNGLFGSDDAITREQMAVILYHFAQSMGMDTTQGGMAVREFADFDSISGYAVASMQWAVNAGVMAGYDGHLMPTQPCTRAQIVTMLYNLLGK